jgi:hypothetical protein
LHPERERYIYDGKTITEKEALDLMDDPTITDDSGFLRLTVIGPEAERKPVLSDIDTNPLLTKYKGRLVIQDYDPTRWEMSCGFVTQGHPTIYVQTPDGKVLHRQDDYRDGADGLAVALRRADPKYNPHGDPDLRKEADPSPAPTGGGGLDLSKIPWWLWAGLAGLGYLLLKQPPVPAK